ncbi:nucleoside triphosphate pyrophosphatase [Mycolicibacterium sp.]|uniref:Maf family protein n=1 Tax=Mycolicibacterium sp. TaxID=2320850 RepID=UPI0025D65A3F|nr:nucleoside triphosphate pyrophosphatase [Mycolicibacterium sp.]
MTRVVLGSASSGRLRVLRSAGIDPLVLVSGVDEDALMASLGDAEPAAVVTALAEAKAEAVARDLDPAVTADCAVIGCDSMLYVNGVLSGKPGTPEQTRRQWNSMAGRSGELFTGHCVIRMLDGETVATETAAAVTTVRFGTPTEAELEDYIATGEPLGVAGAFTIDGLGGWFIDGVDGDPSNVVGLGLSLTRGLLESVGLSLGALWKANPPR